MKSILLTTTSLLAFTLPINAQTLSPQQDQPVAGFGSRFSQRPACSQLEARPGSIGGWQAWGLQYQGEWIQLYGLESMPADKAHDWLEKTGLCVVAGQIISFESDAPVAPLNSFESDDLSEMERRNAERTERVANGESDGSAMGIAFVVGVGAWLWSKRGGRQNTEPSFYSMSVHPAAVTPTAQQVIDQIPVVASPTPIPDVCEPQMSDDPTAYNLLLANPFLSRIFYGGQRTGKTMLMAKASEALAAEGVEVYHVNLASFGDEDAKYFQRHGTASVTGDLVSITDTGKAHRLIERAEKVVTAFMQTTSRAILICDEWKYMANKASAHAERLESLVNRVADIIAGFESAGMKRAKAVWTAAPGIVAGNMQQGGKAVKGLEPVIVAIAPGHTEEWNGQALTFDYQVFNQVAANYQGIFEPSGSFDSSRIALIAGEWLELGDYPKARPEQVEKIVSNEERFVQWAAKQKAVAITYESFKNANAMKDLPRSREAFTEFTDYGILAGVLTPSGEGQFKAIS